MKDQKYTTKDTDSRSYSSGYEVFLSRTNFRERMSDLFGRVSRNFLGKKENLKLLDIGCGNGLMTKRYISALQDCHLDISLLEPASDALEKAKEELGPITDEITPINKSADEYFEAYKNQDKFDLVIASYVFYHLSPSLLPKILESIAPGGHMAIMMGAKEHPLRTDPALRALSKHGDSSSLKEILEDLKIQGKISFSVESTATDLDLNGLWCEGKMSPEGEKFFSFTYNQDLTKFSNNHYSALNSTLEQIFNNASGIAHPTHELIWVTKIC